MRTAVQPSRFHRQGGFTLVATLLILAAVTILVMGLFSLSSSEKNTAGSYDAIEQAELAVQAGFAHASNLLNDVTLSEQNVIMQSYAGDDPEGRPRNLLLSALFSPTSNTWDYTPMVSGMNPPLSTQQILRDTDFDGDGRNDPLLVEATREPTDEEKYAIERMDHPVPSRSVPPMHWETLTLPPDGVTDEKVTARYCFYIEDLQANLSLERVGNNADLNPRSPTYAPGLLNTPHKRQSQADYEDYANQHPGVKRLLVPGLTLRDISIVPSGMSNGALQVWDRPLLSEAGLYTLIDPLVPDDNSLLQMDNRLIAGRKLLDTPWSWKEVLVADDPLVPWVALTRSRAFLRTAPTDVLEDTILARLESSTISGLRRYDEAALIPTFPGVLNGGLFKLNLNKILNEIKVGEDGVESKEDTLEKQAERRHKAVTLIATHIRNFLPEFAKGRRGGFVLGGPEEGNDLDNDGFIDPRPLPPPFGLQPAETADQKKEREFAYLKTLAAGMLDYADEDCLPTTQPGFYRGMDAYPLVSEQWQGYHALSTNAATGSVVIRLSHYAEVWNMTNMPITGEFEYALECNGGFKTSIMEMPIMDMVSEPDGSDYRLIPVPLRDGKTGRYWLKAVDHVPAIGDPPGGRLLGEITLAPNEYRVIKWQDLDFEMKSGLAGAPDRNFEFIGYDNAGSDLSSRYRLRFKPKAVTKSEEKLYEPGKFLEVDQSLAPVERYTRRTIAAVPPPAGARFRHFNTTIPGMSYGRNNGGYKNNLGDPRAAFFINYSQDVVNYEGGSSAWGRSYRSNVGDGLFHGENRIHLWPDGGHSDKRGTPLTAKAAVPNQNESVDPASGKPASFSVEPTKYVQYLSNRGMFYSVTELGHIFDPIMWAPYGSEPNDLAGSGSVPAPQYRDYADIRAGTSTPSSRFCGGNTLRIGRPEHSRFRPIYGMASAPGSPSNRRYCAATLLDLFHCGIPMPDGQYPSESPERAAARMLKEKNGNVVRIDGHINVNTASYDALRAVIVGTLQTDPLVVANATTLGKLHGASPAFPEYAGYLATRIMSNRPYISPSELPERVVEVNPNPTQPNSAILGATTRSSDQAVAPGWNDSAAEEIFARIFNSSTVRSRNFRIVVTGQTVRTRRSGETDVLANRSRMYHVFVKPVRDINTGAIVSQKVEITYARSY